MICETCRKAANLAAYVVVATVTDGAVVGMGSLNSAMRGHETCKGDTWCDCQHQTPLP